ncbi:MAG: hypothetical protein JRG91_20330 [Deltaproteobacteria bacterium]|nr:hypothetical protein [Deltaproteobacteria bacterium]
MLKYTMFVAVTVLILGCGSSVKSTGDASGDADEDGSGDATGDVPTDVPVEVTGDGVGDPVSDTTWEVPETCGDGETDTGEECDDGNDVNGDGCDNDCRYSCHGAGECADGDMCTSDVCTEAHVCVNEELDCADDDPCTTDWCDVGEGCVNSPLPDWYADDDDDGYGDPHDHLCRETRPDGYVDNDDDCCDLFDFVNPAQTSYFTESYDCGGLTRSFDYNCDRVEEQRYTAMGSCVSGSDGSCVGTVGWRGSSVPACGVSHYWMGTCTRSTSGDVCISANSMRTQECR